jgi:hypothetical protein
MDHVNGADTPSAVPSVAEALDAHVSAFEARRGTVVGVRNWTGLQVLGGAEESTTTWHGEDLPFERHYALTLKYLEGSEDDGWQDADRPFVLVTTTDEPEQSLPWHLVVRVERVRPYEQSEDLFPDGQLRDAQRVSTIIRVDGEPTSAEVLTRGDSFASRVDLTDGRIVIVVGRAVPFPTLELETVRDLSPLFETWHRLTDRYRP